jgi:hypothetical protein
LIQHYVMKLVSDLRQVGGFLRILRFRPEILLEVALSTITLTKYLSYKLNLSYATILQCSCGKSHKTGLTIDLFILKNMGAAIIDFRVCPSLVKCKNRMFSGFIDTLMYGFSSTGVTIYCYFGLKFNDNTCCEVICKRRYNDNDLMTTNKLPGMYFSF